MWNKTHAPDPDIGQDFDDDDYKDDWAIEELVQFKRQIFGKEVLLSLCGLFVKILLAAAV